MSSPGYDWAGTLVDRLRRLADPDDPDRAALAHLRRGLDAPADYVLGRVGWLFRGVPEEHLDHAILAAGLFAWVKGAVGQSDGVNLGTAFGRRLSQEDKEQRSRRFIDLIDTDRVELGYKLRQAVTLIARDERATLDWAALVHDLRRWDDPDRRVQKDWARGFWSSTDPTAEAEAAPATT